MHSVREMVARKLFAWTKPGMMSFLQELDRLQWLSTDEQISLQRQQLADFLEYAYVYVPYYRDLFESSGFHPGDYVTNPECFRELPFLTKDIVRHEYERLKTTEPARAANLSRAKTGGTTGEPMWFVRDQIYRDLSAAHLYHQMQWSGWQMGQAQGWLWGHVLSGHGAGSYSLQKQLADRLAGRFRSNAFHLTPESMAQFADWLERYPEALVWSYVSTMYRFAQFVQEQGRSIKLHAVYTAAEPLYDHHRQFVENVFACEVFNSYSSVEIGYIACECDHHDGLHLMMRNCYLEVLRDGQPVSDGEEGEFVLTNFSYGFPFIRYKLEDWGKRRLSSCTCGRGMPVLDIVEGRLIDAFKTRDGHRVWGAFIVPMIPYLGNVKQYQVTQKTVDLLVLRLVVDGPIDQSEVLEIEKACKLALGENVRLECEYVDSLPVSPTGKHRYVVSEVV